MQNYEILAHNLIENSINLKAGEKVLIEYSDCEQEFLNALQKEIFFKNGYPFFKCNNRELHRGNLLHASKELFDAMAEFDKPMYEQVDAVILINGAHNIYEFSDATSAQSALYDKHYSYPIHIKIRLNKKWVLLRYPTPAFAQISNMSTQRFREYFFAVCNLDYKKMEKAMEGLKKLMQNTSNVSIVSPNTNLTFSIEGMPAIKCCGEKNMPDGEIYTAPLKTSVNGTISFNVPAMFNGVKHENIVLTFKNGKVIKASSNYEKLLNNIINLDAGASFLGEFAFGVNPFVTKSCNDILFDEKMCGSIHLALGNAYDDCNNGNTSMLHWDLILNQMPEFGGGSIYFDNVKIRENGLFILPELVALNPENIIN